MLFSEKFILRTFFFHLGVWLLQKCLSPTLWVGTPVIEKLLLTKMRHSIHQRKWRPTCCTKYLGNSSSETPQQHLQIKLCTFGSLKPTLKVSKALHKTQVKQGKTIPFDFGAIQSEPLPSSPGPGSAAPLSRLLPSSPASPASPPPGAVPAGPPWRGKWGTGSQKCHWSIPAPLNLHWTKPQGVRHRASR